MHKLVTILFMTLIFASCGLKKQKHIQQKDGSRQFAISDPTFKSYAQSFTSYAKTYLNQPGFVIGDVPINFGDTENTSFDGVCNTYSDGTKEVIIKQSWWNSASVHQREVMIFHELGHCSLNRDHDSEIISKESYVVKGSIMNPVIPGSSHYLQYKTAYLTELFTYNKAPLQQAIGI
ncbi:hypothetical protein A9Q84_10985 [Halobacteriovorax marinus]|uniref:Lipoprotein n=1 Tax=Halobacteriovorax marinus TaxID=97084 RepID=A0A1Y5F7V7_9BACT|nr:hypothetical protein A9Q84_10985 [Halobacteriovorax marinus]